MKRKIFSKLLMGALLVASVSLYVSCKDYDDDIKDLQTQIDSLNGLVSQKETTIKTLIADLEKASQQADADLKKAMEEATAALKKGYEDADAAIIKGYTDGDVATLAAAKAAIDEAKAALQKTIDENYASLAAKNVEQDVAIEKAQADATAALNALPSKADKADLEAAVVRIGNLETKCESLDKDLKQAIKDIEALQTAVKAQQAALEAVQKLANENKAAVEAVQKQADENSAAISANAKNIADNLVKINQNAKDIADLKTDLAALDTKLETAKKDLSDAIAAAKADLEKKISDAKDELNSNIDAAKTELDGKINDTNSLIASEIAAVNTTITELRTEVLNKANAIDTKYEVITKMLSEALRSLVYIPTLYVDGIETIEYNYLRDSLLNRIDVASWNRTEGATPTKTIARVTDYVLPAKVNEFVFGPAWPVYYHQNPSTASTAYKNVVGFYAYDVETMTRATDLPGNRNNVWGITSPEKYVNGDQLFEGGAILTAGLQIEKPHLLANIKDNDQTSYTTHPNLHSNNDVIVAFQASSDANGKDTVITSDYAMLYPEKIWIEGLVWKKGTETKDFPTYWYKDNTRIKNFWNNDRGYGATSPYREANTAANYPNRDEDCPWLAAANNKKLHIWDTPKEALEHPADIELFIDDLDGVNIMQYIGVHFVHEAVTKAGKDRQPGTWAYNDEELKHFGLRWHLDVVDYSATDRSNPENIIRTLDSRYVHFANPELDANGNVFVNNNTIIANDVIDIDGNNETFTDTKQVGVSRAAAGREPLLRVRLYHMTKADKYADYDNDAQDINGGKYALDCGPKTPILDGYIRVRISAPELKEVEYPKFQTETFDLCNALSKETNWTLFNQKVLAEQLDLEHEQFDALYGAEFKANSSEMLVQYSKPRNYSQLVNGDNGSEFYGYFNETVNNRAFKNVNNVITEGEIGTIEYRKNYQGTTNDAFIWTISEEELEAITHDKAIGTEFTIERYVHFTGHFEGNVGAKYDDVFIKLTRTIKRKEIELAKLKNKDDDYYRFEKYVAPYTGSATTYLSGYEAVAWNAPYPKDAQSDNVPAMMTVPFENNISNAFLDNNGANNPKFDGYDVKTWKYYFTPIEVEIVGLDGVTYVLTPRRGKDDNLFNKFYCAYIKNDLHPFHITINGADKTDVAANRSNGKLDNDVKANEVENNKIVAQCAIKYNTGAVNPYVDGVFANDTLYAVKKTAYSTAIEYEPIVIMNQKTGAVVLLHESVRNVWRTADQQPLTPGVENEYSEIVLNAIGYDEDVYEVGQNPIHEQLRAWTGVIAKSKSCDIALQMSDAAENKKNDNTYATWMNGWERPINVYAGEKNAVDAKNNGNYIYAVDFINMYDWRGYGLDKDNKMTWDASKISWSDQYSRRGAMFGQNYWLWAFYGVKGFTFRMKHTDIQTTLHWGDEWKKLSEVSHNLEFYAGSATQTMQKNANVTVNFSLRTPVDYSYASKNAALINELGFNTADQANGYNPQKAKYGYIFYTNNGDNVQDFYLKVPVRVYYDWGWFDTEVAIKVGGSMGNLDRD
jgi:hypothetical protein